MNTMANEETGANFTAASAKDTAENRRQIMRNSERFLEIENNVYDLAHMTQLISHYIRMLMDSHDAYDQQTKKVALPVETALLIDWASGHATQIKKIMGTDTIPTPYTAKAPIDMVIVEVSLRNPGVMISQ